MDVCTQHYNAPVNNVIVETQTMINVQLNMNPMQYTNQHIMDFRSPYQDDNPKMINIIPANGNPYHCTPM